MEILLLVTIVIIAIAFINFKDYLNHPHKRPQINTQEDAQEINQYQNPYKDQPQPQELSREEKIRNSEYGLIVGLLAKLAQSDGKVCELESELMENTIIDIANALLLQSAMYQKDEILGILHQIFNTTTQSVEELTTHYAERTKGQYKSRLKLVEYMLTLAYADGELGANEREIILDVAAYLEIENSDFNALYDAYEKFYANKAQEKSLQESYAILGVREEDSMESIKSAYKNLVREYHPDILHHKGLDESIIEKHTQKLQEINAAYEMIKAHKNAQK
ncbi:TerB family tellurite resistance protein [Helicobacter turcicus]|uniref:TerB family tellurite resistance protein n=1 Tax=Helicobacter turcicus TaxID=2867412 RepID=A0ABS7JKL8_9HELI|nr:TerB family tellurite resistance protein [Helicobacter turcicus]MBX7489925.1 TerB family tellurite resistance protein [Helicobacter turcicus]MBX7544785.1 TerB family tellurite resistance protein [Helicobacter turcicus]